MTIKKLLLTALLIMTVNVIMAGDNVVFFVFNSQKEAFVENNLVKLEVKYFYLPNEEKPKERPDFWVSLSVTNKTGNPIYIDTGNSFVYQNRTAYCLYGDDITKKRIVPVAPYSTADIWKFNLSNEVRSADYDRAKWFMGLVPKKAKLGYRKDFGPDNTPLRIMSYITCSADENMTNAQKLENVNYVSTIIVDKASKVKLMKEKNRYHKFTYVQFEFFSKRTLYDNVFLYLPVKDCL